MSQPPMVSLRQLQLPDLKLVAARLADREAPRWCLTGSRSPTHEHEVEVELDLRDPLVGVAGWSG